MCSTPHARRHAFAHCCGVLCILGNAAADSLSVPPHCAVFHGRRRAGAGAELPTPHPPRRPAQPTITDVTVYAVARYCPIIHSLHLCRCTKLTEASLTHLVQCCPRLRSLPLPMGFTTEAMLVRIAAYAVNKHVAKVVLECEPKIVGGLRFYDN
jgi:hypothetical protein